MSIEIESKNQIDTVIKFGNICLLEMMFKVLEKKKALKGAIELPSIEKGKYATLLRELEVSGPIRKNWPNFSSLGKNKYHCHLSYSWVACWENVKGSIVIEVYYVGSRENAPY
ncbi:hypothetical protein AB3N59_02540 [Leptospira sp. WS92.C1]